jgi:hypothetical protein
MSEILPPNNDQVSARDYIGFLKGAEAAKGAIGSEIGYFDLILKDLEDKKITEEEAKKAATDVSNGRQYNYH